MLDKRRKRMMKEFFGKTPGSNNDPVVNLNDLARNEKLMVRLRAFEMDAGDLSDCDDSESSQDSEFSGDVNGSGPVKAPVPDESPFPEEEAEAEAMAAKNPHAKKGRAGPIVLDDEIVRLALREAPHKRLVDEDYKPKARHADFIRKSMTVPFQDDNTILVNKAYNPFTKLRVFIGMNRKEFASCVHISPQLLSDVEHGFTLPENLPAPMLDSLKYAGFNVDVMVADYREWKEWDDKRTLVQMYSEYCERIRLYAGGGSRIALFNIMRRILEYEERRRFQCKFRKYLRNKTLSEKDVDYMVRQLNAIVHETMRKDHRIVEKIERNMSEKRKKIYRQFIWGDIEGGNIDMKPNVQEDDE